jgi:hypothetical protein
MNQPVERETDADATETNQLNVTALFCGKLLACPECEHPDALQPSGTRIGTGRSPRRHKAAHGRIADRDGNFTEQGK